MATINLNPTSGIDDAWRTRAPPGWIQFPDGSFGPPNQVGSDWNEPYRGVPTGGTPTPSGGTSIQIGGGGRPIPINDSTGVTLNTNPDPEDGGTFNPRQNSAFRGPRWGGGPPPGFNMNDGTGVKPYINPQTGQPEILNPSGGITSGNQTVAGGGGFNPLTMLGGGNPYWRAILAGAGILQPTPAETGTLDNRPDLWPKRGGGGIGSDANFPVMGVGGFPTTYGAPGQQPAPLDAGGGGRGGGKGGGGRGRINPGTVNLGRGIPGTATAQVANTSPFIGIERQNAPATQGQPGRGYQTALDLGALFGHPAVAAAAAAHPTVQAHVAARVAGPLAARQPSIQNAPLPPPKPTDSQVARLARNPNIKSYTM